MKICSFPISLLTQVIVPTFHYLFKWEKIKVLLMDKIFPKKKFIYIFPTWLEDSIREIKFLASSKRRNKLHKVGTCHILTRLLFHKEPAATMILLFWVAVEQVSDILQTLIRQFSAESSDPLGNLTTSSIGPYQTAKLGLEAVYSQCRSHKQGVMTL